MKLVDMADKHKAMTNRKVIKHRQVVAIKINLLADMAEHLLDKQEVTIATKVVMVLRLDMVINLAVMVHRLVVTVLKLVVTVPQQLANLLLVVDTLGNNSKLVVTLVVMDSLVVTDSREQDGD